MIDYHIGMLPIRYVSKLKIAFDLVRGLISPSDIESWSRHLRIFCWGHGYDYQRHKARNDVHSFDKAVAPRSGSHKHAMEQ